MATKKMITFQDSFMLKLQALYDIEKQLEKALPKLEKAANGEKLKDGFRMHLSETRNHILRLEKAFQILKVKPKPLRAEGIRGIIEDGKWVMQEKADSEIEDLMIAAAARYAEHYEMAGYLSAIQEARILGQDEIARTLEETLHEEESADKKLAMIIENTPAPEVPTI